MKKLFWFIFAMFSLNQFVGIQLLLSKPKKKQVEKAKQATLPTTGASSITPAPTNVSPSSSISSTVVEAPVVTKPSAPDISVPILNYETNTSPTPSPSLVDISAAGAGVTVAENIPIATPVTTQTIEALIIMNVSAGGAIVTPAEAMLASFEKVGISAGGVMVTVAENIPMTTPITTVAGSVPAVISTMMNVSAGGTTVTVAENILSIATTNVTTVPFTTTVIVTPSTIPTPTTTTTSEPAAVVIAPDLTIPSLPTLTFSTSSEPIKIKELPPKEESTNFDYLLYTTDEPQQEPGSTLPGLFYEPPHNKRFHWEHQQYF